MSQIIKFPRWIKLVNNQERKSILDHRYCGVPLDFENLYKIKLFFEDHLMLIFSHEGKIASAVC
jgi:hypothetical protein